MKKTYEVSVVVVVHNQADYLIDAINSIKHQDLKPKEIIVVDLGSTDSSIALAKTQANQVIRLSDRDIVNALKVGVLAASGDAVAFINGQDLWSVDHLSQMVNALDPTNVVFSLIRSFEHEEYGPSLIGLHYDSMLLTKELIDKLDLINIDYLHHVNELVDYFKECGVEFSVINEVLAFYRVNDNPCLEEFSHLLAVNNPLIISEKYHIRVIS